MNCCQPNILVGQIITQNNIIDASDEGVSIINDGIGNEFKLKTFISTDNTLTIDSVSNDTQINIMSNSNILNLGLGESLVINGQAPNFTLKGIREGTGIDVQTVGSDIVITNTSQSSLVTLLDASTNPVSTSLIVDGLGPSLTTKKLVAGNNIALSEVNNDILITNTSQVPSITLLDASTNPVSTSLIGHGLGPSLTTKKLVAGNNITLSELNNDILISTSQIPSITLLSGLNLNITANEINLNEIITLSRVNANLLYDRLGNTSGSYYRPIIHIPVVPRLPPIAGIFYDFNLFDVGNIKLELRGTLIVPASPNSSDFTIDMVFGTFGPVQINSASIISLPSPLLVSFQIDIIPNTVNNILEFYSTFTSSSYTDSTESQIAFTNFNGDVSVSFTTLLNLNSTNLIKYVTAKTLPLP